MGVFLCIIGLGIFIFGGAYIFNDIHIATETVQEGNTQENQESVPLSREDMLNYTYIEQANIYGLDPYLLKAIAIVESSEDPHAVNKASHCYGLMQILCTPDNMNGCKNKLNIDNWPPHSVISLFNMGYNVSIGAQILKWNINTYGILKGVAVYNSWGARNDSKMGPFRNQEYVNKVMGKYHDLQKSGILT